MSTKRIRFIFLFILAFIPVIMLIFTAVYNSANSLSIFPSEKYAAIGWWPIANAESIINSLKVTQRKIVLEHTLEGSPAFAGFGILLDGNYPFLDLSKYSELTVRLTSGRARHFGVIIMTFENGLSQLNDGEYGPWRYCQVRNEIKSNTGSYTIKLVDLKEPEWWLSLYARGKTLDTNPLKGSSIMQFFFDDQELTGQKDRIEVEEIAFHAFSSSLWIALAIGTICYYIVVAGVFFVLPRLRKIKVNRERLLTTYKRIDYTSDKQRDSEILRTYIMEKYTNPNISLEAVSRDTGISRKRIRDTVLGEFSMTFQECINWLRINEAKRLLTETAMSIIDIAFSLGFNSNAYFASNFRNREGLTPKEYREKHSRVK